ncbi:Scr1 family TA system antitoxin-like transcriptional regulator [Sphaerisporangium melleum]|uniref:Scr1 family TA system antitoxin-like transcriptional regulator n=1 Tax=Sphaerisporangium melleum TaxID=321316 RepID=UPI003570B38E
MARLLEVAAHPRVTIQVVPYTAWSAIGLQASFSIAELRGVPTACTSRAHPVA